MELNTLKKVCSRIFETKRLKCTWQLYNIVQIQALEAFGDTMRPQLQIKVLDAIYKQNFE
jgi:hypothetical protein